MTPVAVDTHSRVYSDENEASLPLPTSPDKESNIKQSVGEGVVYAPITQVNLAEDALANYGSRTFDSGSQKESVNHTGGALVTNGSVHPITGDGPTVVDIPVDNRVNGDAKLANGSASQLVGGQVEMKPRRGTLSSTFRMPGEKGEMDDVDGQSFESSVDGGRYHCLRSFFDVKMRYKLLLTCGVLLTILLSHCAVSVRWLLPYYYTVLTPLLVGYRVYQYMKMKWMPFLFDFCYFLNIAFIIFIWVCPDNEPYFVAIFGMTNGPVAWAIIVFRNALVFHDVDRFTSAHIHVAPLLLSYIIRWFPEDTSLYWHKPFLTSFTLNSSPSSDLPLAFPGVDYPIIWMTAIPMAAYIVHAIIQNLIENKCVAKDHLSSYRYFTRAKAKGTFMYNLITTCGRTSTPWTWSGVQIVYGALGMVVARLWYESFIAHTIFVSVALLSVVYQGAAFYIEVFTLKGIEAPSA